MLGDDGPEGGVGSVDAVEGGEVPAGRRDEGGLLLRQVGLCAEPQAAGGGDAGSCSDGASGSPAGASGFAVCFGRAMRSIALVDLHQGNSAMGGQSNVRVRAQCWKRVPCWVIAWQLCLAIARDLLRVDWVTALFGGIGPMTPG